MEKILIRNALRVSEVNLFKAFDCWKDNYLQRNSADDSNDMIQQKVNNLLNMIRFSLMTLPEFSEAVVMQSSLNCEDIANIITVYRKPLDSKTNVSRRQGCFGREYNVWLYLGLKKPYFYFKTNSDIYLTKLQINWVYWEIKSFDIYSQIDKCIFEVIRSSDEKDDIICFQFVKPFFLSTNNINTKLFLIIIVNLLKLWTTTEKLWISFAVKYQVSFKWSLLLRNQNYMTSMWFCFFAIRPALTVNQRL